MFVPLVMYIASCAALHSSVMVKYLWLAGPLHLTEKAIWLAVVLLNLRLPGAKAIFGGMVLNLAAMLANGGLMPATPGALVAVFGESYLKLAKSMPLVHSSIMDGRCPLWFLCDIIPAHKPYALVPAVYSVGDMVMSVGIMIAIISLMRAPSTAKVKSAERGTA